SLRRKTRGVTGNPALDPAFLDLTAERSYTSKQLVFDNSRSGETGRRAGLKIPWGSPPVWVRFPPPAPRFLKICTDSHLLRRAEPSHFPYPSPCAEMNRR